MRNEDGLLVIQPTTTTHTTTTTTRTFTTTTVTTTTFTTTTFTTRTLTTVTFTTTTATRTTVTSTATATTTTTTTSSATSTTDTATVTTTETSTTTSSSSTTSTETTTATSTTQTTTTTSTDTATTTTATSTTATTTTATRTSTTTTTATKTSTTVTSTTVTTTTRTSTSTATSTTLTSTSTTRTTVTKTTLANFDCQAGITHLDSWSELKLDSCCARWANTFSWPVGAKDHCCVIPRAGCLGARRPSTTVPVRQTVVEDMDAYDCLIGLDDFLFIWSEPRQAWCCANKNVGCTSTVTTTTRSPGEYDCFRGLFNDSVAWTADQVDWCCTFHHMGCSKEVVDDSGSGTPSGWMGTKEMPAPKEVSDSGGDENLFDCHAGLEEAAWTFEKATWCCERKKLGCGKVTDTQAKFTQVPLRPSRSWPPPFAWCALALGACCSLLAFSAGARRAVERAARWRGRRRRRRDPTASEDPLSRRSLIAFSPYEGASQGLE